MSRNAQASSLASNRWNVWHLVLAAILGTAGILVCWEPWADIFSLAQKDEEYSHIFIVPLVALWMVWVRRARFRFCRPTGTILGPLVVALGWVISAIGFYNGVQVFWHGGAVVVFVGCLLSVTGKGVLFQFFPAFAVLVFLVPFPPMIRQNIAQPLQTWTAGIAFGIFEMIGVDATRSGNLISVNGVPVTVAEACNGIRMVFALILVVYAFAFGLPLRNFVRFLLLALSPFAAIVVNVPRILANALIYGNFDESVGNAFHDYSGWLMLPIAFLILYGIIKVLRWAMIPVTRYTLAAQ